MKKTTIPFQKTDGLLRPAYFGQFDDIQDQTPEGGWLSVTFEKPKKPKTCEQLGYLYANRGSEGVYAFMMRQFKEQWGELYTISLKINLTNIDICMKELFCKHKGIKKFNKTSASTADLAEYIKFIDNFSIQNFGCELPPPKKKQGESDENYN